MTHPPVGQPRFWVVQAVVAVIAAVHLLTDLRPPAEMGAFPAGLPVALLGIPVGYAALRWGLAGSAATGIWATLLWLPDLLLPPDEGHFGADLVDLALIVAVAFVFGWQIDAERSARAREQRETEARAEAERRAMRYASVVVEAEEDQRRRIARELHDEPLQLFLHLARRLASLAEAPGVPAQVSTGLAESRQQALDAAGRLRNIAAGLRPPALDQLGLVAALSSLVDEVEDRSDLEAELQVSGVPVRLPPGLELGAFRIVQEAVRNAVRHATAERLRVSVGFGDAAVTLDVVDDGTGFDATGVDQDVGHLGLLGMTERAHLLGGRFSLETVPGHGTAVHADLPLQPAVEPLG